MSNLYEYIESVYQSSYSEKINDNTYNDNNVDFESINTLLDLAENETNFYITYNEKDFHSCQIKFFEHTKIFCSFNTCNRIYCKKEDNNSKIFLCQGTIKKIIVFDNGTIYEEMTPRGQQSKLIPITIKRIATFYEYKNPFAVKFFDLVFQFYCNQNPIYKDIYRFIKSDSVMIVPLGFNEINNYHNLKEMFLDKYKTAAEIKYNWNKRNPNLSYLIIKSYNYVCPDQREKLTQIVECPFSEVKINSYYTYTSNVKTFLIWVLQDRCSIDDENQLQIIKDYVYMCFRTHTKVNINFKSVKKIRAAHDELTKRYSHKDTPVIKIKKDTAFKQLRKILPKEFEWIKTRKRLIEETVIQHHCVWSYADKINKDKCQIYSYVDSATGKRYTLEFVIRKGKYACVQLYGVNNTFDETAKKLKKDVCDLIANHK